MVGAFFPHLNCLSSSLNPYLEQSSDFGTGPGRDKNKVTSTHRYPLLLAPMTLISIEAQEPNVQSLTSLSTRFPIKERIWLEFTLELLIIEVIQTFGLQ